MVHDVKPTVCAMFPIGRYLTLSADDSFLKNPEELSVGYIFNNPECGDGIRNTYRPGMVSVVLTFH